MYFAVAASGESHLWRQRFPDGAPEQITFGITNDERGVVADPDGRSLITSIGAIQGTVWYHDDRGDRQKATHTGPWYREMEQKCSI